jgi:hypothetical protein
MTGLVEFLQCQDLVDGNGFAATLCGTAGGGVSSRAAAMLMGVCTSARHSPVVVLLLQFLAQRASADRQLLRLVRVTRLLMVVRDKSQTAAMAYQHALQALPAAIPPLCAYNSSCAGHIMMRAQASRAGAFAALFELVAEHAARPLERAHVRANMQAAVVCMHKCIVNVGDRLCLVSERETYDAVVLSAIGQGLLGKYDLLTHDINVEYISVGVLECVCVSRFDGAIFEHLLVRFCDCVSEGHDLMALFVHHSLLRLLSCGPLRTALAAHLLAHRSLDYILTRVYTNPDVSPDAHAAVAAVAAEMVNAACEVDDDSFGRVEQMVAVIMEPPCALGVRECYAYLLARAVLYYAGAMPADTANRVMQTMCQIGVHDFAASSPVQVHLCSALHDIAFARGNAVLATTWLHVLSFAWGLCGHSTHDLTAERLRLFLHALREAPTEALFAALQRMELLSAVLRDREYVADSPECVVLVLKIMHVFTQRLSHHNLASAQAAVVGLDLGESMRQLCRACVEEPRVYGGAGGRSLMLLLGRLLHTFAQTRVLPRSDMRDLALNLVAHSLGNAGRGNQHILRMHKVARLWMVHQHVLPAASGATLSRLVEAATNNAAMHRAVRVSTLCLLRQILARNAERCACVHGQHAQCRAMFMYCVRALGGGCNGDAGGASLPCDLATYTTAQRVLHIIATSQQHAANKVRLRSSTHKQLVNALNAARCNLQTEIPSCQDAAALDKSILRSLQVVDDE